MYVNRKRIYLEGAFNSPESRADYDKKCRELLSLRTEPDKFHTTVFQLYEQFMEHAKVYYRKHGKETSEVSCFRQACAPLLELYAMMPVRDFDSEHLEQVQELMQDWKIIRNSLNRHIGRIRRMFKWGARKKLVPLEVFARLDADYVPDLIEGRCRAEDNDPVEGVPLERVELIKPFVTRHVWGIIMVQYYGAMRASEVLRMRAIDIKVRPNPEEVDGEQWEYHPPVYKTEHHKNKKKHKRRVAIGPKAREIIRQFMTTDVMAPIFDPAQARREFVTAKYGKGKKANRRKGAPAHYTLAGYECSVRRACEKAFEMPKHLRKINPKLKPSEQEELKEMAAAWRKENCFTPHQLRHEMSTLIDEEFDAESAQIALGHQRLDTTEGYIHRKMTKAQEIARKLG